MKYKAIFFDADGVLIKSKHLFTEQLEKDFGMDTKKMLPFFLGIFRECGIGKADLKKELAKVLVDWEWKGTVEELMEYWFTKGTEIDPEAIKYVQELRSKGIRCYMATDQEKYRGEHLRNTLGGGKIFDDVFYSADVRSKKKKQPFWDHVFSQLKDVSTNECFFTDDSKSNIEAVADFGLDTYLFSNLDDLKKHLNQYV